jgi:hypothetical protein
MEKFKKLTADDRRRPKVSPEPLTIPKIIISEHEEIPE